MDKNKDSGKKDAIPAKKPVKKLKMNKATEEFKRQYYSYYNDVKGFNNGTKEDW